jgi:hypothetical protein
VVSFKLVLDEKKFHFDFLRIYTEYTRYAHVRSALVYLIKQSTSPCMYQSVSIRFLGLELMIFGIYPITESIDSLQCTLSIW